jgi:hypothetical protein
MTLPPTPLREGISCALSCRDSARETLDDEAYSVYVAASLEIYTRENARLVHGDALRATREAAEE